MSSNSCIRVACRQHMHTLTCLCVWDMTHPYIWHDLFIRVTWLVHMKWILHMTWLIFISDMTHLRVGTCADVWREIFIWYTPHAQEPACHEVWRFRVHFSFVLQPVLGCLLSPPTLPPFAVKMYTIIGYVCTHIRVYVCAFTYKLMCKHVHRKYSRPDTRNVRPQRTYTHTHTHTQYSRTHTATQQHT